MPGNQFTVASVFMGSYSKHYGTHVPIRLIEEWRTNLDQNKIIGAVLLDLSKAFDCICQDLLIAKFNAYGFDRKALKLIYSYLKGRKQSVRVNNIYSNFLELFSGVLKGSVLGTLLFNIFLNDLFLFIRKASLHKYADDNTLPASSTYVASLMELLSQESYTTIDWLISNNKILNDKKFQTIILTKRNLQNNAATLSINNMKIKPKDRVELLAVTIDDKLTFEKHMNKLFNPIFRLKNFFSFQAKNVLIESFVYSNFNF